MFGCYADVPVRGLGFLGLNGSATIAGGGGIDVGGGLGGVLGAHWGWQLAPNTKARLIVRKKSFGATSYSPWIAGLQLEQYLTVFTKR